MDSEKEENKNSQDQSWWPKLERIILLFTFLCTLTGTIYAVITSNKALKISSNELRPWISVVRIDPYFHKDAMRNKFVIQNVGKVPAFVITDVQVEVDGKKINLVLDEKDVPKGPIVLMPGQIVRRPSFYMKGDKYRKLLKGSYNPKVYQDISVTYTDDKNIIDKYFVYYRVKFQPEKIPRPLPSGIYQGAGLWTFEESDFK